MNIFKKKTIRKSLATWVSDALKKEFPQLEKDFRARIDYAPKFALGHYSSPVAMEMAKELKQSPRSIAEKVQSSLMHSDYAHLFDEITIAGPGFLNFKFSVEAFSFLTGVNFSFSQRVKDFFPLRSEPRILMEFVSANPTGPLNIVSARAAACGDAICRILRKGGYMVEREYYVNDYGNQVKNLGISFAYRFLQRAGVTIDLPEQCYQGEYIKEILENILDTQFPDFLKSINAEALQKNENALLAFVENAGEYFAPLAVDILLESQKQDLQDFGVDFNRFFRESNLHEDGDVASVLERLKKTTHVYEQENALFFKSTDFNDDKDRVIIRADGRPTYLLADIAYHYNKIKRGYHEIYDIWGPDHHGYIARLKGALLALGFPDKKSDVPNRFQVLIVQQVNLIEDGKPVVMSKRLGQFHTMRDLIKKIPVDAARYFFSMRSMSTHLDFDLELALTQNSKNPVYYIQYAHARICSIFRENKRDEDAYENLEKEGMNFLRQNNREELLCFVLRFPELIEEICENHEMHRMATYLFDLATLFTQFYHHDDNRIKQKIESAPEEGDLLLHLCRLTQVVLSSGLDTLGVSAPREM